FLVNCLLRKLSKTNPLITQSQLTLITQLQNTEPDSSILVISSEYSPYVLAYSQRRTIAPGLFDENQWNLAQWQEFWTINSTQETKELMQVYEKPIYLFAGTKAFNNPCFEVYLEQDNNKIYKYVC
ncbi:MAG: hypothetical protein KKE50_00535, partial [Nanoarchaeota archaeon]|nr:hypothetical protein [Nanoarchaeota archaeon]